jgi:hypothetical protein
MASRNAYEHRKRAVACLSLARKTAEDRARASLLLMAQRWLDLAEAAERAAWRQSAQRRNIQAAIGEELRTLYSLSHCLPPRLLALLAELNGDGQ